jgi:Flp pilus assembly protein TadD
MQKMQLAHIGRSSNRYQTIPREETTENRICTIEASVPWNVEVLGSVLPNSKQRKRGPGCLLCLCQLSCLLLGIAPAAACQGMGSERASAGTPGQTLSLPVFGRELQDAIHPAAIEAATRDLQKGTDLTRQGQFAKALPLLESARAQGIGGYAGAFNLALTYVGVGQYASAVALLQELQSSGIKTAAVSNLLAQAYLGEQNPQEAWASIQDAARLSPTDEKMYALLMNACSDHYEFHLGLKTSELGLQSQPNSARLHYERAVFLARLDRLEEANPEFKKAAALAPGTDLGYLALVQERLYEQDFTQATTLVRRAISTGHRDYQMLSLLGMVLMESGAAPGEPNFSEARSALEASVAERQDYPTSQIALGKLYLMEGKFQEAIAHLEVGRRMDPQNPSVYTSLAAAYRRIGNKEASQQSLRTLSSLLREKATTSASQAVYP